MLEFPSLFIVFFISSSFRLVLALLWDTVPPWDKMALGCSGLWFLLRPVQVICLAVDMTQISAQQKATFLTSVNADSQVECRICMQLRPASGQDIKGPAHLQWCLFCGQRVAFPKPFCGRDLQVAPGSEKRVGCWHQFGTFSECQGFPFPS